LSADTRKTSPYCVVYSDGEVEWRTASEARSEHCAAQQLARLLSISSHDSLVDMLGLRVACGYQEVVKAYNEAVKLIHPDKHGLPGTDVAFMKLQPAYTEWNTARAPALQHANSKFKFGWQRKGAVCARAACDHGSPHALLALSSIRARRHLFNSQRANSRSTELSAFQGLSYRSR